MGMAADPPQSDPPADILLAAAFAPELAALDASFGGATEGHVAGLRVAARAVGVGLVAAAAGAARHIDRARPRAVVLLGTCGAYASSNLALGEVIVSRVVRLVEPMVFAGSMQFPDPMRTRIACQDRLCEALARCGARPADVATTLGITVDDDAAEIVARSSAAHVEHLEAFAVALACDAANVPFAAVLGVANRVGSRGRQEWREHHQRASAGAVEHAVRWIHDGAVGSSTEHRRRGSP
ncbi:MAG TPA: hypothetical protein VEK07_15710 [Polyangiaceae bacterium]|nr:hypothetical protein [Polyangiaceae bacterium]